MLLSKKVALVTGSSRGIGRAIAVSLASEGAKVAVNYRSSEDEAREVVEYIRENEPGEAEPFRADVAQKEEVEAMVGEVVDTFGGLDILVNNAGITDDGLLLRMKPAQWQRVMEVNLNGVYHCCRLSLRHLMRSDQGRIINVSSVVGLVGNAGQTNYCAAKAGVVGFSKALAKEIASRDVTVNVVAPGFIDTDMTQQLNEKLRKEMVERVPLGRPGTAGEVAEVVSFLSSDKAAYITGQVIPVDGGMAMQG